MADSDLHRLLERHTAFWNGEGDAPLKRVTPYASLEERGGIPLADGSRAAEGQYIAPDLIDPRRFYGEHAGPESPVNGDFMAGAAPPALCWTEAILGCPVRIVTGGPWAEPFVETPDDLDRLEPDGRWLEKLDAFIDFLSARAAGRYPIVQPLFRGPIDMMAAALGHDRTCIALLESPAAGAFLERCADIFIQAAKRRLARTPPFQGGYLSSYGIWAPGPVVRTQLDNATLLSPGTYARRVFEQDRRVIEAFDYPLIHVHSGCLHIVDHLLGIDALKVIQVSIDHPGGPLAREILPALRKILQTKPLILTGPVTQAELHSLEALSPQGRLCLQVQLIPE